MKNTILLFTVFLMFSTLISAQEKKGITITKQLKTTAVKSQDRTGTCWSYATTSFIETEILRMGGEELNLSEMYFAYYGYINKADKYFRYHGNNNFGQGGQAHDVINVVKKYGFVPEKDFTGLVNGETVHNHSELASVLENVIKAVVKSKKPTTAWKKAYKGILDAYLGEIPTKINYNGTDYSPFDFSTKAMKFNADDYVEFTSYQYLPFNQQVVIDIPDNWSHDLYYNLPIDELMKIINYAVNKGYSVAWDGDVSEKEFSHRKGLAAYAEKLNVTDAMRQEVFDNYQTTDDHLMHLTGLAKNEKGEILYQIKNSWGASSNDFGGYLYMSEDFVRLQTVAFMVHKDAIPKEIKKKLNIK